jgi:hypothetical protein
VVGTVKVALYARVSAKRQQERGTISSELPRFEPLLTQTSTR